MKLKRLLPILVLSASILSACGDENAASSSSASPDITIAPMILQATQPLGAKTI